jgi:hypothetical protein
MRRILAAAVLGTALFGAAACSDKPAGSASASPSAAGSTSTSAASPSTAAGADTKAICSAVNTQKSQFITKVTPLIGVVTDTKSDPAKVNEAVDKAKAAFVELVTGLKAEAAKAQDPALKKALEDLVKGNEAAVAKLTADPQALLKDPAKVLAIVSAADLEAANTAVEKACGLS